MPLATGDGQWYESEFAFAMNRPTINPEEVNSQTPAQAYTTQTGSPYQASNYDTDLNEEEFTNYGKWVTKQSDSTGRNLWNDEEDYDLRGFYKEHGDVDLSGGEHLTDKYKKPSHPTFSIDSKYHGLVGENGVPYEGGEWVNEKGKWHFHAGEDNLWFHGPQKLIEYFQKYEPDAQLILPGS